MTLVERLRAAAPGTMLSMQVSDLAALREAADEIERLRDVPAKLRAKHFEAAHTDMIGDEERREGYLMALKDVEALSQQLEEKAK